MEKIMSVEEKIRRAEEIYLRRQGENTTRTQTQKVPVNNTEKKDIKLLKKMIKQIIVCILIYIAIYTIQNSQFIFSEDFIKKANEILSYDTNFFEIYENTKNGVLQIHNQIQNQLNGVKQETKPENTKQDEQQNEAQNENQEQTGNQLKSEEQVQSENQEKDIKTNENQGEGIGGATENQEKTVTLSQEEQDIANIKNITNFVKPTEGTISSKYGYRETATGTVPKNHTGVDIATYIGAKIVSATDGEVVLSSEEGDYGKHLKIQNGEISIIYAHCNNLYVKHGDQVKQGQEIAEVGSTGNSTGPHLHFEIRFQERTVDPEKIVAL